MCQSAAVLSLLWNKKINLILLEKPKDAFSGRTHSLCLRSWVWAWAPHRQTIVGVVSAMVLLISLCLSVFLPPNKEWKTEFNSNLMQTEVACWIRQSLGSSGKNCSSWCRGRRKACLKTTVSSLFRIPSCWLIRNHKEKQKERWEVAASPGLDYVGAAARGLGEHCLRKIMRLLH